MTIIFREEGTNGIITKLGPTGINNYDGPDCVLSFSGGSNIRNKSCEFWVGLIPDQPFTNYARDIYEEHIAYRTLKDDDNFRINTHEDVKAELIMFTILEPYPGKFTGIRFELMYWMTPKDAIIDGEPKCGEFYEYPSVCEGIQDEYKPVYNTYSHTKEFFVKIQLPEGMTIREDLYMKSVPCWWDDKGPSEFGEKFNLDYLCFYYNNSFVYAFNSTNQRGTTFASGHRDIAIQVDGIYIHENLTEIKKESGYLKFGVFETNIFHVEYPIINRDAQLLYIKQNYSLEIIHFHQENEEKTYFYFKIKANDSYDLDCVFRIDFPDDISLVEMTGLVFDGNLFLNDDLNKLNESNYFSRNNENHSYIWKMLNISDYNIVKNTFVIYPFYELKKQTDETVLEKEEIEIQLNFTIINYRSFKPFGINFYRTNDNFNTLFQQETINIKFIQMYVIYM